MSTSFAIRCPNCQHTMSIEVRSAKPAISKSVVDKESNGESKMPKERAPNANPEDMERLEEYLALIDDESLNPWEKSFVSDFRQRYIKYQSTIRVSEKQMNMIKNIALGEGNF